MLNAYKVVGKLAERNGFPSTSKGPVLRLCLSPSTLIKNEPEKYFPPLFGKQANLTGPDKNIFFTKHPTVNNFLTAILNGNLPLAEKMREEFGAQWEPSSKAHTLGLDNSLMRLICLQYKGEENGLFDHQTEIQSAIYADPTISASYINQHRLLYAAVVLAAHTKGAKCAQELYDDVSGHILKIFPTITDVKTRLELFSLLAVAMVNKPVVHHYSTGARTALAESLECHKKLSSLAESLEIPLGSYMKISYANAANIAAFHEITTQADVNKPAHASAPSSSP